RMISPTRVFFKSPCSSAKIKTPAVMTNTRYLMRTISPIRQLPSRKSRGGTLIWLGPQNTFTSSLSTSITPSVIKICRVGIPVNRPDNQAFHDKAQEQPGRTGAQKPRSKTPGPKIQPHSGIGAPDEQAAVGEIEHVHETENESQSRGQEKKQHSRRQTVDGQIDH